MRPSGTRAVLHPLCTISLPSNGPRPAAAQLVAWRAVWRAVRRAARRVDDAMACGREHSVLLAGVV